MSNAAGRMREWWFELAGGPVRARVLFVLACVLGLDTADIGTVGAIAGKLEHALSLNNTELGLLAAIPAFCSAVATIPMGVLTDRTSRTRLLQIAILAWAGAQALSGLAQSFEMLFLTRLALGAATAATIPAVASLVGDLFQASERGQIWGLILSGELIGAAFGYVIAGEAATFGPGSWRYAFFVLAIPSLGAALAVRRWLPEPARGGRSRLRRGATKFIASDDARPGERAPQGQEEYAKTETQKKVEEQRVEPDPELVLRSDPARMSLWRATLYVLRVRTNVVLIIASALGYFYFTGVTTFGLVYFQDRYHVAHGTATVLLAFLGLGGLAGVIAGGRIADRFLHQGHVNSRIIVGGLSFALTAVLFLPGLLFGTVAISLPFFVLAAIAFGARNPPLDAARLDIMHHRLWGRAEAVRTLLRRLLTASAPVVFGFIADQLVPASAHATTHGAHGFGANANAQGLKLAFLILLITLAAGGIMTLFGTRTFPRDVATARASEDATAKAGNSDPDLRRAA
jgi:MFS family permease